MHYTEDEIMHYDQMFLDFLSKQPKLAQSAILVTLFLIALALLSLCGLYFCWHRSNGGGDFRLTAGDFAFLSVFFGLEAFWLPDQSGRLMEALFRKFVRS